MRVFVIFLTLLVCFPLPSHGKDIGDLFGKLLGGVLNEATRQQQKQQQRQQLNQFKVDLNACYNDQDVVSCDRALAFPALNQTIRRQIQIARNKAFAFQEKQNSGIDRQRRTFVSPRNSNSSGQTSILRQDLIREEARSARLNRALDDEIDRVTILEKRMIELKDSLVVRSKRANKLTADLQKLTLQKRNERRSLITALGVFALLILLLALKIWRNESPAHIPKITGERKHINSAHLDAPRTDPPIGIPAPALPPVKITGNMPNDIRHILYG